MASITNPPPKPGDEQRVTIDNLGRVTIPAAWQEVLQGRFAFITNHLAQGQRALVLFTPDEWERFEDKIGRRALSSAEARLLQAFFLPNSAEVPIVQGRITISQELCGFLRSREFFLCRPDKRWMV